MNVHLETCQTVTGLLYAVWVGDTFTICATGLPPSNHSEFDLSLKEAKFLYQQLRERLDSHE